jgi:ABC-type transport system involved in multi-copper enzyme maturation permease subunit
MIWLTWRQFRTQAAAGFAVVTGFAIVLALTGPRLADLARLNPNVYDVLTKPDRNLFVVGVIVVGLAPAIVGAFWGAPMVARELESGTHRLVWSQSVTRTRWLATKLAVTTAAAAAAVGALTLAVSWWAEPIDGALSSTHGNLPARLTPVTFAMRGIVPVGYTVFALVLGVAIGTVLRRPLPAMAVTLAVFTFVQVAVPLWVRPHLVPAVQETVTITTARLDGIQLSERGEFRISVNTASQNAWVLSNETVDATGAAVALPAWLSECLPGPPPSPSSASPPRAPVAAGSLDSCFARLTAQGYRQRVVYQPASHFWPLQWVETALYLAFSGLLTWFCFWWTRRRLS